MTLTLTMLRCPDTVPPQTRTVAGGEFSIGRGAANDWVLPDPERFLSGRHCLLAYRSGGWQIADLSTNGTFLNNEAAPIGHGQPRELRDGDRFRLGAYEIELHVAETALPSRADSIDPFAASARETRDPFAGRGEFDQDPLLRSGPEQDPFAAGLAQPSINLPADYDPLMPEPDEGPFAGPTQPDHSPHLEDAFAVPAARAVLPEDWDRELGPQPAVRPPAAVEPAPAAALPAAPAPSAAAAGDLLADFLRGAGLPEARPADQAATMEMLGAAFRAFVAGLRQALIARAAIKGELRIETTLIRSRGNNPLKFSADDDDALMALIGAGRNAGMDAAAAVSEALRDIRRHELATIAAMQTAVRALLAELDPVKLRRSAERGGLDFVPMQKRAHAWDAFAARHAELTQALADNFDSAFGKAFARAYEQALAEASAEEPAT
ncbi:MAG TPA: type VI secretion system-associated FHA domain protein TagH [Stellaceae bacterium]|jgi:type VI secretion system protein ImpI/type VI secretion system protein